MIEDLPSTQIWARWDSTIHISMWKGSEKRPKLWGLAHNEEGKVSLKYKSFCTNESWDSRLFQKSIRSHDITCNREMAITTWFSWIRTKMIISFAMHDDWFHNLSQDPILKTAQISVSVQSLSHSKDGDVVNIFFASSMDSWMDAIINYQEERSTRKQFWEKDYCSAYQIKA